MGLKYFKHLWQKLRHLHHLEHCDDLNIFYKKYLIKLSQHYLTIYLPFVVFLYLCPLLLCRTVVFRTAYDIRAICYFLCCGIASILCFITRCRMKWRRFWNFLRFSFIGLLLIPIVFTYRTEQWHLLLSLISILLIYCSFSFSLIKSFILSLGVSILQLLLISLEKETLQWTSVELISIVLYHIMIHIAGLHSYLSTIERIREHFQRYQICLYEKNKAIVDCKKLRTIMNYCRQPSYLIQTSNNAK
jgi:hypothetical protein